ncbi:MAG TPA: S8 family serine peptidase [Bacillota bacterium]|nr:S8 family serine peptidase [Bacillota bacterium]
MGGGLQKEYGSRLWRGGEPIEVEKEKDRFTLIPLYQDKLEYISRLPGVQQVKPLNKHIYRVKINAARRDYAMNLLRTDPFNGIVHHAYHPVGEAGTVYYLTDKITVKLLPECSTAELEQLLAKYKLKYIKEYEQLRQTYLLQVTTTSGENPLKLTNRLTEEELVVAAEPNLLNRFCPSFVPSDPLFKRQWHLAAADGPQLVAGASVDAPDAWEITRGERKITVAVIDDGFDLSHPDFCGKGKIVNPTDYVDGDKRPYPEAQHDDYHGTPCAGVALAECNGQGTVGVAPGCAFMPVRFSLAVDDDTLIEIFYETGSYAHVISCSWGPPPVYAPLSTALNEALTELSIHGGPDGNGVVIAIAAANFNVPISSPGIPGGFIWLDYGSGKKQKTTGRILNGLAAHPRTLTVAASTSLNKHAAYSNWGPEVDVAAPSNNFHPLDPSQYVAGRGIWTTDNERHGLGFTADSRFTDSFGGTSSATPLAAGVAALVRSANPALAALEVIRILQDTADKIVDVDPDPVLGTNRGRYDAEGRCDWFGFGKVNAAKAVRKAREFVPPKRTGQ